MVWDCALLQEKGVCVNGFSSDTPVLSFFFCVGRGPVFKAMSAHRGNRNFSKGINYLLRTRNFQSVEFVDISGPIATF